MFTASGTYRMMRTEDEVPGILAELMRKQYFVLINPRTNRRGQGCGSRRRCTPPCASSIVAS